MHPKVRLKLRLYLYFHYAPLSPNDRTHLARTSRGLYLELGRLEGQEQQQGTGQELRSKGCKYYKVFASASIKASIYKMTRLSTSRSPSL